MSKTVNGITTRQVWEGNNLLFETDNSGAIKNQYVRGLNLIKTADSNTYYHYNAHGDVVFLTGSDGTVKDTQKYS